MIYLDDDEFIIIDKAGYSISNIKSKKIVSKSLTKIDLTIEEIEKGKFPHFMLKEIHDQKHSISDTMRGRLNLNDGTTNLGGIVNYIPNILSASRIYITACGTSWHAGLIGKHLIEEYARVPVHVEYASEFRYRNAIIDANTIVIAISQYGETADTLAALKKAKDNGCTTILNPAPAKDIDQKLFSSIDFFTPNEIEAGHFLKKDLKSKSDIESAAKDFLDKGIKNIIITLGEKGLYFANNQEKYFVDTFKLKNKVVDTTGAGDAFNGAFAFALANDYKFKDALEFANKIAAISTTKLGAANSMPRINEIEKY